MTPRLSQRQLAILGFIEAHPGCKTHDIVAEFGFSRETTRSVVESLYTRRLIGRQLGLFRSSPTTWWLEVRDAGEPVRNLASSLPPVPEVAAGGSWAQQRDEVRRVRPGLGQRRDQPATVQPTPDIDEAWEAHPHLTRSEVEALLRRRRNVGAR